MRNPLQVWTLKRAIKLTLPTVAKGGTWVCSASALEGRLVKQNKDEITIRVEGVVHGKESSLHRFAEVEQPSVLVDLSAANVDAVQTVNE